MFPFWRRAAICGLGAVILAGLGPAGIALAQIRAPITIYPVMSRGRGHLSLVPLNALLPKVDIDRVRAWVVAARQHQPGQADDPAKSVSAWPPATLATTLTDVSELSQMLVYFHLPKRDTAATATLTYRGRSFEPAALDELLGVTAAERRDGHANHLLELGAVLHTDIATIVPAGSPVGTSQGASENSVRVADGEVLGIDGNSQHWTYARYLLEAVESQPPQDAVKWNDFVPDSSRDEHVRSWYRAAAAWQGYQRHWSEAMSTLARGAELFPDDERLIFYRGTMHEVFATPEVQGAAQSAIRSGIGINVVVDRKELATAESLLRRAAALTPNDAEVRLRLARVLQLLDRHEEAARQLKDVVGVLTDPVLAYDAALFLGVSQQTLGDVGEARASFERAARLAPSAQSPLLALSQLERRAGDSAAALAPLGRLLASDRIQNEPDDPWWSYSHSHLRDAGLLMAQMRRILAGGGGP